MVKKAGTSSGLSSGPFGAGCGTAAVGGGMTPSPRTRMRHAVRRMRGCPSAAESTASTSSIRRPGRTTDARTSTRPTGTGPRMS